MKVGIGYANPKAPLTGGREVAEAALAAGAISHPKMVLAFCSGSVDHRAFFNELRQVVGESTPIIGGSAIGVITNDNLSYAGSPCGVAIFESDDIEWHWASAAGLDSDEYATGKQLGEALLRENERASILLFYDSLKVPATPSSPPIMNASPALLQGIAAAGRPAPNVIGAGLLGDYTFETALQFCGTHVASQIAVGLRFGDNIRTYSKIMHGCTPHDGIYHTVTRSDGARLLQIDGKPAVDVIDTLYGNTDWRKQVPVRRLSIGVNNGDKYAEFEENNFINRLIAGVLPNNEGIVLFEPDLPEGTEILFMIRDAEEMFQSARNNTMALLAQIRQDGHRPLFGLYIDCAGRTAEFSWTETEEAEEIQRLFNSEKIPLLGFYSGVEIAPLPGESRGLDWTGVLMVLAQ